MCSSRGIHRLRTKNEPFKATQTRSEGFRRRRGGGRRGMGRRRPGKEGLGRQQLNLELPYLGLKRLLKAALFSLRSAAFFFQLTRLSLPLPSPFLPPRPAAAAVCPASVSATSARSLASASAFRAFSPCSLAMRSATARTEPAVNLMPSRSPAACAAANPPPGLDPVHAPRQGRAVQFVTTGQQPLCLLKFLA